MGTRRADALLDGVCAFLLGVDNTGFESVARNTVLLRRPVAWPEFTDDEEPDRGVAADAARLADVPELLAPLEGGVCKVVGVRRPVTSPER